MNVSIITTFYYGNRYIKQYIDMIKRVIEETHNTNSIEVILVNDSPQEKLIVPEKCFDNYKIIDNDKNSGIHQSRVNGLNVASNEYVIFVDQDDLLEPNVINEYEKVNGNYDVIVANGVYEGDVNKKIYKNKRSQWYATKEIGYKYVRNLIVSPGHCIIRKESIPEEWKKNIMAINGSDDYFLWLLMHFYNKKFAYTNELLYIHKDTGQNLSVDEEKMYKSSLEFIKKMDTNIKMGKYAKKIERTVRFKFNYKVAEKKEKLKLAIKHPITFIINTIYYIFFKGI